MVSRGAAAAAEAANDAISGIEKRLLTLSSPARLSPHLLLFRERKWREEQPNPRGSCSRMYFMTVTWTAVERRQSCLSSVCAREEKPFPLSPPA